MEIWGHTLVKNEERWLWYSVTSVIDYLDKLLLWDSGSTDGTLDIIKELLKKYPQKILFRKSLISDVDDFARVRQKMLDETKCDWFIILDGDEIWWNDSIKRLVREIKSASEQIESIVVPTVNLVGDIFHYQEKAAGRYKFGDKIGHYNLRAIKRTLPGLKSKGRHGMWGWADGEGNQIQDRYTFQFVDSPYIHASFVGRGGNKDKDREVAKRGKKLKYELGLSFPTDYYYPEAFFRARPAIVPSPWHNYTSKYFVRGLFETPLRFLKRRIYYGPAGY